MSKLKINLKTISQLNPCLDRLDNYIKHYAHRSFTLREFLALDKITHQDKLWVILRLVDDDTKVIFALDCIFAAYVDANAAANAASAYAYVDAAYAANVAYADVDAYADANAAANAAAYTADAAAYAAANAAYADANAAYADANAAYADAYDADADAYANANAAANANAEQARQLESLIYLIEGKI